MRGYIPMCKATALRGLAGLFVLFGGLVLLFQRNRLSLSTLQAFECAILRMHPEIAALEKRVEITDQNSGNDVASCMKKNQ